MSMKTENPSILSRDELLEKLLSLHSADPQRRALVTMAVGELWKAIDELRVQGHALRVVYQPGLGRSDEEVEELPGGLPAQAHNPVVYPSPQERAVANPMPYPQPESLAAPGDDWPNSREPDSVPLKKEKESDPTHAPKAHVEKPVKPTLRNPQPKGT